MELGIGQHGSSHYRRRYKIRAPCCSEVFDCRHFHDEARNALEINPLDRHDLPRHEVEMVICSLCGTEQEVHQWCTNCGVCMGKFSCSKCKFFDDDVARTPMPHNSATRWFGSCAMTVRKHQRLITMC